MIDGRRQYKVFGQVAMYYERIINAYDSDDALGTATEFVVEKINEITGCTYEDNKLVADFQRRSVIDAE